MSDEYTAEYNADLFAAVWGKGEATTLTSGAQVWTWQALDKAVWEADPSKPITLYMSETLYHRLRRAYQRAKKRHWQISQRERAQIKRRRRAQAKVRTALYYRFH